MTYRLTQTIHPDGTTEVTSTEGLGQTCTDYFKNLEQALGRDIEGLDRNTEDFTCETTLQRETETLSQ